MKITHVVACAVCGAMIVAGVGCKASARQRPLSTSPIDTGANTTNDIRKQLEGVWTMTGLEMHTSDGRKASIDASGALTYDEYGNLDVQYRLNDPGRKAIEGLGIDLNVPKFSTQGRVAINTQQNIITYITEESANAAPFDRELAARRADPFSLDRPRYYTLDGGVLTLQTRYDNGQPAAISVWKKGGQ